MSVAPPDGSPAGGVLSSSLLQQILLCAALGWIVARVLCIVCQPKAELAEFIGLAEPASPVIVVEGLGSTWAAIYWYYPANEGRSAGKRRPKARKYVVTVGNQVIEVAREQRRVVVENLEPDTSYKVLVRAIQATSAHSHSHLPHVGSTSSLSTTTGSGSALDDELSSIIGTSDPGAVVVSSSIYLHTLNSGPVAESIPPLSTLLRDQPLDPISIESTKDITALQAETRSVLEQFDASEADYGMKYRALIQEFNAVNEQRKLEESQRAHLRAVSKSCEDRKHALDIQLSKLKQRATHVTKYRADIESSTRQLVDLEQQHSERKKEHQQKIETLDGEYHALAARESRLSRSAKDLAQQLKHTEAEVSRAHEFLNKLKDTGQSNPAQQLELLEASGVSALGEQGKELIEHELRLDERIEREWVRAQKSLEQRYVEAYLSSSEKEAQRLALQTHPKPLAMPAIAAAAAASSSPLVTPSSPRSSLDNVSGPRNPLSLAQSTPPPVHEQQPPSTPGSAKDLSNHNPVLSMNTAMMQQSLSPAPSQNTGTGQPPHVPSYSSLQSAPSMSLRTSTSIPSMDSMASVQSLRAVPTLPSTSPLSNIPQQAAGTSGQLTTLTPFSSVAAAQPFGPSYAFGGQPPFPYPRRNTPPNADVEEVLLSPSSARDLIPSNLFQDNDYGDGDAGEGDPILDIQETPRAPARTQTKDSSPWLPWLSPHTRSHNRSSSLFFGSAHDANDTPGHSVFTSYSDTFERDDQSSYWGSPGNKSRGHDLDHDHDHGHNHDHGHEDGNEHEHDYHDHDHDTEHEHDQTSSPSKTPRKRGGSRFFHKTGSGSKHGNFVRRLSIFSRKDAGEGAEAAASAAANAAASTASNNGD